MSKIDTVIKSENFDYLYENAALLYYDSVASLQELKYFPKEKFPLYQMESIKTEMMLPTLGSQNPELMNKPFWKYMVQRPVLGGYDANEVMKTKYYPNWTFQRFGHANILLADGTRIYVGGEHEDSYDPDFYIYNDVVVIDKDGEIKIYGYPMEIFPPIDCGHTLQLVDNHIYISGGQRYDHIDTEKSPYRFRRDRKNTKVYKLSLTDFSMSVATADEVSKLPKVIVPKKIPLLSKKISK